MSIGDASPRTRYNVASMGGYMINFEDMFVLALRSTYACLISALSGAALWLVFFSASVVLQLSQSVSLQHGMALAVEGVISGAPMMLMGGGVVFLIMVFLGMPLRAALQALRQTSFLPNAVLAALMGSALFLLASETLRPFEGYNGAWNRPLEVRWNELGIGAVLGFYFGSIAWLVRRPDRDAARVRKISTPLTVS